MLYYKKVLQKGTINLESLTIEQEIEVLRQAFERKKFLGNGSSRAVYELNDEWVVKIANSEEGRVQNRNEVYLYSLEVMRPVLATIKAFSPNIIVMQKVQPYDSDDVAAFLYDSSEAAMEAMDVRADDEYKILDVVEALEEVIGETEDNYQIGMSSKGFVAYDYGFIAHESGQVGDIDEEIDYEEPESFIELTINRLRDKQEGYGI